MANFSGMVLTTKGLNLLAKAQTGATLTFTRVGVGDGEWPPSTNPEALTALVNEKLSLPIQDLSIEGDGTSKLRVVITNEGLEAGFILREVGVFADDPDEDEILYAATYAGDQYDFLPASGGTPVEKVLDIYTVTANAQSVTAVISNLVVIATKQDIDEHDADEEAHPALQSAAESGVATHNSDALAHAAIRSLLTGAEAEIRVLRKQVIVDKILAETPSAAYEDGFIADCAQLSDIDQAASSGYIHDGTPGVFRPVPAETDATRTASFAAADVAQEDVKGSVTQFVCDTANTSGHFNAAKGAKALAGCRMVIGGTDYGISSIAGDGTASNSVTFLGTLATGAHTVQGIHGTIVTGGATGLSQYTSPQSAISRTLGTAIGNMTGCGGLAAAFDGTTSHVTGACAALQNITSANIGKQYATGKRVTGVKFWGSSDLGVTDHSSFTYKVQGSNDGSSWTDIYVSGAITNDPAGSVFTQLTGFTPGVYLHYRVYFEIPSTACLYVAELEFYEEPLAAPANTNYAAISPLLAASGWSDINSASRVETLNGANAWYAVSFDGGNTYRVWTGSAWLDVAKLDAGTWKYWTGTAWQDAYANNAHAALAEACGVTGNRMTGSTLAGISDANWSTPGASVRVGVVLNSASIANVPTVGSVTFNVDIPAVPMVLVFDAPAELALAAEPTSAWPFLAIEPVDTINVATDLTAQVSKDDGAAWTTVTLDESVEFLADQFLVSGIAALPSGDDRDLRVKLTVAAGKNVKVHAAGVFVELAN